MISVNECMPLVRGICETCIFALSMANWIAVMYAFLDKKKCVLVINLLTFFVQFGELQVFMSVTDKILFQRNSRLVYSFANLPVALLIGVSFLGFIIGIISIFAFTNRKRKRISMDGIPKENLLLHERALKLQNDSARLAEMNEQMKKYGEEMQEQIKEKEILEAKMNIHSGMNRLLLASRQAVEFNNPDEIKKAVDLWKRDALLLCKEADNKPVAQLFSDLKTLAKSFNLNFECTGITNLNSDKEITLVYKTACECMANAVKHAGADSFFIAATNSTITFSNNGKLPDDSEIELGGGLGAVKTLAYDAGYEMDCRLSDKFNLILRKKG